MLHHKTSIIVIAAVAVAISLFITLVGCTNTNKAPDSSSNTPSSSAENVVSNATNTSSGNSLEQSNGAFVAVVSGGYAGGVHYVYLCELDGTVYKLNLDENKDIAGNKNLYEISTMEYAELAKQYGEKNVANNQIDFQKLYDGLSQIPDNAKLVKYGDSVVIMDGYDTTWTMIRGNKEERIVCSTNPMKILENSEQIFTESGFDLSNASM